MHPATVGIAAYCHWHGCSYTTPPIYAVFVPISLASSGGGSQWVWSSAAPPLSLPPCSPPHTYNNIMSVLLQCMSIYITHTAAGGINVTWLEARASLAATYSTCRLHYCWYACSLSFRYSIQHIEWLSLTQLIMLMVEVVPPSGTVYTAYWMAVINSASGGGIELILA